MKHLWTILAAVLVSLCCAPIVGAEEKAPAAAKPQDDTVSVVGAGSRWKRYFAFFPPTISKEEAKKAGLDPEDREARSKAIRGKVGKGRRGRRENFAPNLVNPLPPEGWEKPEFDDSAWLHDQATDFAISDRRVRFRDSEDYLRAAWGTDRYVEEVGLIVQRGRFTVNDPSKVQQLTLSLVYRGGIVAYLNGKEITRAHLPKGKLTPKTGAEVYPLEVNLGPETGSNGKKTRPALNLMGTHRNVVKYSKYWAQKERRHGPVDIDTAVLRKGVNVLAIANHRSNYLAANKKASLGFAAVGMSECHLRAKADDGAIVSAFARPSGLKVWNQHLWESTLTADFCNPAESLRPIRIVAARNGTFSGKVIAGSTKTIEGLSAAIGELKDANGKAIPAEALRIRYGAINLTHAGTTGVWKRGVGGSRFDALLDSPPDSIAPAKMVQTKVHSKLLGVPAGMASAAVVPIWVTVQVPKDAAPGEYQGALTINAKGAEAIKVPVKLSVANWSLPDIKDYGSLLFIYQSPDTLAKYFKVEPWSDAHWKMIESSLKLMGEAGNIGLIFPLQAESAMGNAESLIPWIKKGDGAYDYDFTRFDRYLETALKYHSKERLKVIALNVWGAENKPVKFKNRGADGKVVKTYGKNPRTQITVVDKSTGKKSKMLMPGYGTPEAEALWKPVLLEVKKRLEAKGLFSKAMLGMAWDVTPHPTHVAMFRNILGDLPWFRESHYDKRTVPYDANDKSKIIRVGCNSIVWGGSVPDPNKKRLYGWKYDPKHMVLNFNRFGTLSVVLMGFPRPWSFRMWMESTLACGRNGNGRCGGDFFRAGYSRGSGNAGCMFGSYPRSQVGQTGLGNNVCDLFAPGPQGPVTSVRFENAREGNQEAEARIVIEKALLNKDKPLPAELAKKCQSLLDQRTHIMRMWNIIEHKSGSAAKAKIGTAGWQDSTLTLFNLAGEVLKQQ